MECKDKQTTNDDVDMVELGTIGNYSTPCLITVIIKSQVFVAPPCNNKATQIFVAPSYDNKASSITQWL